MNISPTLRHKGELTESEILSILPQFTSITPERTDEFAADIRALMRDSNYNRFLTTLAGSFKQFLYNEFSELEEHYRDHLSLIGNLLTKKEKDNTVKNTGPFQLQSNEQKRTKYLIRSLITLLFSLH